jgi:acetyltransferase-like isoleucine patch superfamily enzyme
MSYFLHPQGLCETSAVGEGTRIWAFAHVLKGAVIGRDCNICDHVFIENDVTIGDRVTVKCGVQLWDGIRVGDDVFIGPNATFTNDPFPRSRKYQATILTTLLRRGCSVGAGATILPGIVIGENAMIGAGSVVTSDVQPNAIVTGNPARVVGYAGSEPPFDLAESSRAATAVMPTAVPGVTLHRLKLVESMRGNISVGEYPHEVPFLPRRFYSIFDVPGTRVRGERALRSCDQFFICIKGRCSIVVDDGQRRQEILLDEPNLGAHVPPMIWLTMYKFSTDAVLMVLASTGYDPGDYLRNYQDYLAEASPS